jgi:diguanylate cyclase (GGDEF)-like protein/PAS domain S-box-containing protein
MLALRGGATRRAEKKLREAEAKYQTLVEQLPLVTYIDALTPTATAIYASPQVESLLGYSVQEWLDDPEFFAKLLHPDDRERVLAQVDHCNTTAEPFRSEYRLIARDGRTVWVQDESLVVCDDNGRPLFTQGYLLDITDRKRAEDERRWAEEQVWHQALHDGLTGLPNRTLFHDRVGEAIERARRSGSPFAVLVMDIDRFKEVNDTLGHHSGDALLHSLGGRLRSRVRACDTVARLGGDEFGFLLQEVIADEAVELVERIKRALVEPFTLQQLPLQIESSIGIALYPEHGETVDVLLQRADVAMYVAKRSGSGFAFYDAEKDDYTLSRLTMVGDLGRALQQRELELHFQPLVRLEDGVVTAAEALLHWPHPTRGLVPPDEFVPIAERTALMGPLTSYVIDEALRECAAWRRSGHDLTVAVNVSMRSLLDSEFPAEVEASLEKWEIPARCLGLEITEHGVVADRFRVKAVLEQLGEMELRLTIDDFGTGYSSLAYLRRLPLHELKIDRSFVHALTTDRSDAAIVRSTIDLGRSLGLNVVAEGVDTEETYVALFELGCDLAQGDYLSPPQAAGQFAAWLQRGGSSEIRASAVDPGRPRMVIPSLDRGRREDDCRAAGAD